MGFQIQRIWLSKCVRQLELKSLLADAAKRVWWQQEIWESGQTHWEWANGQGGNHLSMILGQKIFPTSCCLFLSNCVSNKSWENFFFTTRFFEVKTIINQKLHRTPEIFVGWIRMSLWFFWYFLSIYIRTNPFWSKRFRKKQQKKVTYFFVKKSVSTNDQCRLRFVSYKRKKMLILPD